jgi:hypothetical protein
LFWYEHIVFLHHLRRKLLATCAFVFVGLLSARSGNALEFILLSATDNRLFSVRTPLSAPAGIGTVAAGTDLYELVAASPTQLYTFDRDGNTLIIIDRSNGALLGATQLDQNIQVSRRGFDLSPTGVLYGLLPGMELRTIDPITGVTTFIANVTGAARVEAIAFALDGTLYAVGSADDNASSESLYVLSISTGELTYVGQMAVTDVDALTFGADGFLYGVDSQAGQMAHLMKIDPNTAAVEDLGNTGVFAANGIVAIREPRIIITKSGNDSLVSWPTNAVGFTLESARDLDAADSWLPVLLPTFVVGGRNVITNDNRDERAFFRLVRGTP